MIWDKNSEPDFVNDAGVKWWMDRDLTRYGQTRGCADIIIWRAVCPDGVGSFLATRGRDIIYDTQSLDALGCWQDLQGLLDAGKEKSLTPQSNQ